MSIASNALQAQITRQYSSQVFQFSHIYCNTNTHSCASHESFLLQLMESWGRGSLGIRLHLPGCIFIEGCVYVHESLNLFLLLHQHRNNTTEQTTLHTQPTEHQDQDITCIASLSGSISPNKWAGPENEPVPICKFPRYTCVCQLMTLSCCRMWRFRCRKYSQMRICNV